MNPIGIWVKGQRTIVLSVVAGLIAVLLQADTQEIINLSPMVKLLFQFGLTIVMPLIPIYLRKGIDNALSEGSNAEVREDEQG